MPQAHKIKFVTELPINGVGKVDKKVLKAGFRSGAAGWSDSELSAATPA
jgi:non-ribosomal peptide synthetase component E (peptide arylation enzyme)